MAAKEALFALLENQQSPVEELIQTALACARLHKLSIKTLSKWIWETYEVDIDSDIDLGTSVESHVRALAILSRETGRDNYGGKEITDEAGTGTLSEPRDNSEDGKWDDHDSTKDRNDEEGTSKARALAIAAIAGHQNEERMDDGTTVSTHILTVVQHVLEQMEEERCESRKREAILNNQIKELNENLKKLSKLVVAQAEIMKEEKIAALDRETRLTKRVQNLEGMISKLSDSIMEAANNNSENHDKIARKLSDLKALSAPRQPKTISGQQKTRETTDQKEEGEKDKSLRTAGTTSSCTRPTGGVHDPPNEPSKTGGVRPSNEPSKTPAPKALETDGDDLRENPWRTAAKKGKEKSFSESLRSPPRTSEAKQLRGSGQIRRAVYYLRGISPECTAVDIQRYCDQRRIRVSSCRILPTRRFGTNAARLSVAQIDAEKEGIMSEDFWPEHITIRPWVFPEEGEIIDSRRN